MGNNVMRNHARRGLPVCIYTFDFKSCTSVKSNTKVAKKKKKPFQKSPK